MCGNPLRLLSPIAMAFGGLSDARRRERQQRQAQAENLRAQQKLAADQAKAEANARRGPNLAGMFARNTQSAGAASTMLSGNQGVPGSLLTLGYNTPLGG